jgi:hypothetical protein
MRWGKVIAGENGEAGSCFSGCDVIICKLGPLHPNPLSMLENTHYGNQFNERLNSFTEFMRTIMNNEQFWILTKIKLKIAIFESNCCFSPKTGMSIRGRWFWMETEGKRQEWAMRPVGNLEIKVADGIIEYHE